MTNGQTSVPTQPESERLSIIKYQLSVARDQSNNPAPLSALSINSIQDAVESLLALVADHRRVRLNNNYEFLQLFDSVIAELGDPGELAGFRSSMLSMNKARVNFKHHGNVPADTTIRRHLACAEEFASDLVTHAFGVDLQDVSLLQFVRCPAARDHLSKAKSMWTAGERNDGLAQLRHAFDNLIGDYERRKVWSSGRSLFSTRPNVIPSPLNIKGSGRQIEKAYEWLDSLDRWVKNLALGIDMRRYAYFDAHVPKFTLDKFHEYRMNDEIVNEEAFERCFKFVMDTALSFAADDFDFDP